MGEYFTFTRKERIGILTIVLLIVLIWIFPQIIKSSNSQIPLGDTSWITAMRALDHREKDSDGAAHGDVQNFNDPVSDHPGKQHLDHAERKPFYFDPNTLSPEGWKKLGLSEKTIITIQNYLRKGGRFNRGEDVKKIYGIHPDEFARLAPYIKIETKKDGRGSNSDADFDKRLLLEKMKHDLVEINTADTTAFIALPGIGSKLAIRIINFRDKLGGFYSVDQVSETYGLPDSTFQKIKPWLKLEVVSLTKIKINTATKEEMKLHPYVKWVLANAIVEYRNQHGKYSSIDDLKKISAITEEAFEKIKPYISLE